MKKKIVKIFYKSPDKTELQKEINDYLTKSYEVDSILHSLSSDENFVYLIMTFVN